MIFKLKTILLQIFPKLYFCQCHCLLLKYVCYNTERHKLLIEAYFKQKMILEIYFLQIIQTASCMNLHIKKQSTKSQSITIISVIQVSLDKLITVSKIIRIRQYSLLIKEFPYSFQQLFNKMQRQNANLSEFFARKLETNYKYSCLVTMAMDLTKAHNLYKLSNSVAKSNNISKQKNYAIFVVRMAVLLRESSLSLDNIFNYLGSRHQDMAVEKFPSLSQEQIQMIQNKCKLDLMIFRRAFECQGKDRSKTLLQLYKKGNNQKFNVKHEKQSKFLAKVMDMCLAESQKQIQELSSLLDEIFEDEHSSVSSLPVVCQKPEILSKNIKIGCTVSVSESQSQSVSIFQEEESVSELRQIIMMNGVSECELSYMSNSTWVSHSRRDNLSHYLMDQKLLEQVSFTESKMDFFETLLAELDESSN